MENVVIHWKNIENMMIYGKKYGKYMVIYWKNHGKDGDLYGKYMGNIWEIYGDLYGKYISYGDGSKPWYLVNPKIAGKWMFIPLKMLLIGIDPYPYEESCKIQGQSLNYIYH